MNAGYNNQGLKVYQEKMNECFKAYQETVNCEFVKAFLTAHNRQRPHFTYRTRRNIHCFPKSKL